MQEVGYGLFLSSLRKQINLLFVCEEGAEDLLFCMQVPD